jgi:hypothetical protein
MKTFLSERGSERVLQRVDREPRQFYGKVGEKLR